MNREELIRALQNDVLNQKGIITLVNDLLTENNKLKMELNDLKGVKEAESPQKVEAPKKK